MKKGEQRFESLLLKCLFPGGVPAGHAAKIPQTPERTATLRAIHIIGKDIAARNEIELLDDVDEEV